MVRSMKVCNGNEKEREKKSKKWRKSREASRECVREGEARKRVSDKAPVE